MTEPQSRITNRLRPLVAAVLVVCLVVGAAIPAAGLLADSPTADRAASDGAATDANAASTDAIRAGQSGGNESDTNATASAGARLAGAIGSQQSEAAGEIETRTLLVRLGRADSPEERAAVLAVLEERTDARLASLRERRERLRAAADNRSVSPGAYAHLAATVSVEATVTERLADRGERATTDLPAAVTAEYGLSASRFNALANDSRSVAASLRSDLRALGAPHDTDEIGAENGLDAGKMLDDLDDTVDPANRTDWPFDRNDSTLGDALDGENESLDLDGVFDDGDTSGTGDATDESATDDSLDGAVTDDRTVDGSDGTPDGTTDRNTTDSDGESAEKDADDGLFDG
ncbi:hypothetical protein [Halorientalis sp. IM1011]|uniref:hypothetical protein n=1 Tax=Halorientalis sp. IM1011 TaxID=1932360 RepID=UPI0012F7D3BF|nr:hypothetical protein [Halorientalis sp. IM1011]